MWLVRPVTSCGVPEWVIVVPGGLTAKFAAEPPQSTIIHFGKRFPMTSSAWRPRQARQNDPHALLITAYMVTMT
ncbi:hypothetical protein BKA01_008144 [Pseudonocardia eucalypti]|uniref:hypothetical protein n=1 Tax=Pseudonocardia eucalypti TaxID=648755 RepID=UPI00160C28A2|nr:hypothetical protein [Pseudonocardia eucalypti]